MFKKTNIAVALEVKFAKYKKKHPLGISADIRKLEELDEKLKLDKKPKELDIYKYILVAGYYKGNLLKRIENEKKEVYEAIKTAMKDPEQNNLNIGWVGKSAKIPRAPQFSVIILRVPLSGKNLTRK